MGLTSIGLLALLGQFTVPVLKTGAQTEQTLPASSSTIRGSIVLSADAGVLMFNDGTTWKKLPTETTAAMTLYVDPTGSDSNPCTATGTAACLTLQGVWDKLPKILRHDVTVNVAAGNYSFSSRLDGIVWGTTATTGTAGVNIFVEGPPLVAVTPATGTSTGVTTGLTSNGNNVPLPVFTDATQSWTVNNLQGRFVRMTSGAQSGQVRAIVSNTATTLTTTAWSTTPLGGAAYAIETPAVVITGEQSITGFGGTSGVLRFSRLDFTSTATTVATVTMSGNGATTSTTTFPLSRVLKTAGASSALSCSRMPAASAGNITGVSSAPYVAQVSGSGTGAAAFFSDVAVFQGGFLAISPSIAVAVRTSVARPGTGQPNIVGVTTGAAATAIQFGDLSFTNSGVSQNSITAICPVGSTGIGVEWGGAGATRNLAVENCGTGVAVNRPAAGLEYIRPSIFSVVVALACTNTTTCVSVIKGGSTDFLGSTPTFTGVTNELQLDGVTYPFSFLTSLPAPQVISNSYGSRFIR